MNPTRTKSRVTFAATPPAGGRACEGPEDGSAIEHWRDNDGNLCARGFVADGYGWMDLLGEARFRFDSRHREVTAFAQPGVSPDRVYDAYCHAALPVAWHFFGGEVLHASAVRTAGGIVAFCAVSETGKSTLAGAFGARGYALWADDAVALDTDDGGDGADPIRTMLLPFSPRLRPPSAQALGEGDTIVEQQTDGAFTASPLAALCVLERSKGSQRDVAIRRLSPSEAFTAILPHAFCFSLRDPARKRAMLAFYLTVAVRTPVFALAFVPGFERLPAILDAIEAAVPGFASCHSAGGKPHRLVVASGL